MLVVDLRLGPGIDGLAVAERVRREGLRIVLHTNYVNPNVVSRAKRLGVTVVEKGVSTRSDAPSRADGALSLGRDQTRLSPTRGGARRSDRCRR